MARGDATYAHLGWDIGSAGDVNNDGYDNIIAGAVRYDFNNISHAFVWYDSENGLDPGGASPRPIGMPSNADWTASDPTNTSDWGNGFGSRVGHAGDVNGDTYDDIFVGAPYASNGEAQEGMVYVYYGSTNGLDPGGSSPRPSGNPMNADW
jgi:hypothetical protein